MATEREIQLVEAALKAAAQECERMARVLDLHGAQRCAGTILSLDRAAIVASVPVDEKGPTPQYSWSADGKTVLFKNFDECMAYENRKAAQATQQVELTDAEILQEALKMPSEVEAVKYYRNKLGCTLRLAFDTVRGARALLSANQGK